MELTKLQLKMLNEIGSLGSESAAAALTRLFKKKIDPSVSGIAIIPKEELPSLFKRGEPLTAIHFIISGDINAILAVMFSRKNALNLLDAMIDKPSGYTQFIGEMGQSTLKEVANILCGSYISAIANTLRLDLTPSIPELAFNIPATEDILAFSKIEPSHLIVIESVFTTKSLSSTGELLLILDEVSLERIYKKLGKNG